MLFHLTLEAMQSWKILNPICHVVVPCSSDYDDLAVVFSPHILS